ncbi:MAG TPA: hypothetical protein VF407_19750 [Polyangiaceae bacterium]
MAHQNLNAVALAALVLAACGGNEATTAPAQAAPDVASSSPGLPLDAKGWGEIHSPRYQLTVRLPDAKRWAVVKSQKDLFTAAHAPSRSALQVGTFAEDELVNRAMCEQKARDLGLVPKSMTNATTIEDQSFVNAQDFDTRAWVSLRPGPKEGELTGDLFAFGAHVRKCLYVHFATIVTSEKEADALSERLAAARLHILGDLRLDEIEAVPRQAPR